MKPVKRTGPAHWGLILLSFLFAISLGCGSARRALPEQTGGERSSNMAQGERVFFQYCHQCHPGGEAGLGPALNNKPLPKFLMKFQIRHGLGAMPGFSEDTISSHELDDLVTYLITLRQTD